MLNKIKSKINDRISVFHNELNNIHEDVKQLNNYIMKINIKLGEVEDTKNTLNALTKKFELIERTNRNISEVMWAEVFNSVSKNSKWFLDPAIAPGRWAVGYQILYILYRVLNEFKPKCILEFGLGQSTRMMTQYVDNIKDVKHIVVEHDEKWVNFFKKDINVSPKTIIELMDWEWISFKDANVRCYKNSYAKLADLQYDLIVIDGPLGGDMPDYARIDVLKLIPNSIAKDFIIILDDYERSGEKSTANEISEALEKNNIDFATGIYSGQKDCIVWASLNNSFFCSM